MNKRLVVYSVMPVMILITVFGSLNTNVYIDFADYSVKCLDLDFNISKKLNYEKDKNF